MNKTFRLYNDHGNPGWAPNTWNLSLKKKERFNSITQAASMEDNIFIRTWNRHSDSHQLQLFAKVWSLRTSTVLIASQDIESSTMIQHAIFGNSPFSALLKLFLFVSERSTDAGFFDKQCFMKTTPRLCGCCLQDVDGLPFQRKKKKKLSSSGAHFRSPPISTTQSYHDPK